MKGMKTLWLILTAFGWLGATGSALAFRQTSQQQNPPTEQEAAMPQQAEQKPEGASVPAAKVNLYVYRLREFDGSGLKPSVYADEKQLARMKNGRFFVAKLAPGKHSIRSNDKASVIVVDLELGQDYYVRIDIVNSNHPRYLPGRGRPTLVPPEQGGYEMKQTKLLSDSDIKNHELVAPAAKPSPEQ
jgi:Protein of unknown function (DUF2846)